jgi:hypothetical protein
MNEPALTMGEEEDETKKEERARLLELVERAIEEIKEARKEVLAKITGEKR